MKTSRWRLAVVSVQLALVLAASAVAQPKRVELDDLGREVTLSGPRLAPDGRQVAMREGRHGSHGDPLQGTRGAPFPRTRPPGPPGSTRTGHQTALRKS